MLGLTLLPHKLGAIAVLIALLVASALFYRHSLIQDGRHAERAVCDAEKALHDRAIQQAEALARTNIVKVNKTHEKTIQRLQGNQGPNPAAGPRVDDFLSSLYLDNSGNPR